MASSFVRLLLLRHGEVDANRELRFVGRTDVPLNANGRRQAQRLAELFAAVLIDSLQTSPLDRTVDTARAVAAAAGTEVESEQRLIELDFGSWEGLSRAEILARGQHDADLLARWDEDPALPTPGGESLVDVRRRVVEVADELLDTSCGSTVALVTHMGPIKCLVCAAMGVPLDTARRLFLDPATISVVDWGERPVVRLFNGHTHHGWENARWMQRSRD